MKGLNIFTLLLVVVLLNASPALAGFQCTGSPDISVVIKNGQACGGIVPCEVGHYCDINAICSPNKVAGDSCVREDDCPYGTQCVGSSATNKKCQTNANPGETCNDSSGPWCGVGDCTANKCTGGLHNDGCKNDVDCASGKCSNKVCKPSTDNGDACPCGFGQYCRNLECAAQKTSGSCTSGGDECAPGYSCIPNNFKDNAPRTCIKEHSVANGEWCHQDNGVCASGLCHRGHCIGKSPVSCGNCILSESCSCEGGYVLGGSGTCKEDKCRPLMSAFYDCTNLNCQSSDRDYSQSCANRLCAEAWSAYVTCDPLNVLLMMST